MGMGIGINAHNPDEGLLKAKQESVACGVWFTATGNSMPKLIKIRNEDGSILVIDNIRNIYHEKKYYCGIPIIEYACSTYDRGIERFFTLYYYVEDSKWQISWK